MRALAEIAHDWAVRTFGLKHVTSRRLRGMRFVEEAIELTRALGVVSKEDVMRIVADVYDNRSEATSQNIFRELGQTMMTMSILAEELALGSPEFAMAVEVRRVLGLPAEHFQQREAAKIDKGLT